MAEPAIGGNTPISFNTTTNVNQPIDLSEAMPFPVTIPTNNNNITAISQRLFENVNIENNVRQIQDSEGEIVPVKIANFIKNGIKRVTGKYAQNYFDFDTYDLSVLNVINDADVDFKFILCLKDGQYSIPQLYATKNLYETLTASYQYGNTIGVNDIINERNIIVVDIEPLKNKVEDLRVSELALDINLSNVSEREYVQVFRNLFVNSNYETTETNELRAKPTYSIVELLKYISWVVSKPAQNYENRVLRASTLGEWKIRETNEIPNQNDPSTPINQEVDDNNNPPPPPTQQYPPIGRRGVRDEEEVSLDGVLYIWDAILEEWVETNRDDIPGGGS
jgi:hypothetical protein